MGSIYPAFTRGKEVEKHFGSRVRGIAGVTGGVQGLLPVQAFSVKGLEEIPDHRHILRPETTSLQANFVVVLYLRVPSVHQHVGRNVFDDLGYAADKTVVPETAKLVAG